MTLNKWIPALLSLTVFIYSQAGNPLTEFIRNEHLVVAGNDSDGISKLWITPKLSDSASTIAVTLGPNFSISSAFNEQSSRNRELLVESSYISNTASLHHVFVPLENGVLNVTFMYNGSATQDSETITVVQPHQLYHFGSPCPRNCASLGVYEIRDSLYTLCASPNGVCQCKLSQTNQQLSTISLSTRECHRLLYPNSDESDIIVQQISDVVDYAPSQIGQRLLFALNRHIYQRDLAYSTDVMPIYFSNNRNCQVVLRLQKVEPKLLIYCANNTMVEYNFDTDYLSQFNNHLYFPCSETANFLVNVTNNENVDIHYNYRMDNGPHQLSLPQVRRFKLGECIMYEGHHLFLYTDRGNNLHLINSSMLTPNNFSTSNQYARPLIINKRYVVAYNLSQRTISIFDLQDIHTPIITQQDIMPYQFVTVISNLSTIIEIEPTATSTPSSIMTLSPTSSFSTRTPASSASAIVTSVTVVLDISTSESPGSKLVVGPPIGIAIAIITVVIVTINAIGFSIIWCCRRQKSKSSPTMIASSESTSSSGERHRILLSGSRFTLNQNISCSEILAGSQFDGSSRRSSAIHSQGHESSYQHEIVLSDVIAPTQETNINEASSNAAQQVVPRAGSRP